MDFNQYRNSYVNTIEESLRFSGKEHDFFTRIKADFLGEIVEACLPGVPHPKLLDVGCGHGLIHAHLKNKKWEIVGVEVADAVIELAKAANPDVQYHAHDGKTLPFLAGQFDVVMAICVMHHVVPADWIDFLNEMKRMLRPGGIAVVFEHNPYNPWTRYIVANNVLDEDAVLLSSRTLKKMMHQVGYRSVKSRNILFTPFAHGFFRWLDKVLGWLPIGAQYYSIGRV